MYREWELGDREGDVRYRVYFMNGVGEMFFESEHATRMRAAAWVNYLNGGSGEFMPILRMGVCEIY